MKALFLADLVPTQGVTNELFKKKDIDTLFGDTLSIFDGCDLKFVNLECALTENGEPIEKFGPALRACPETAEVLKEIGINLCGIANNHVFDYGKIGLRDTVAALEENGLAYTGIGENYEDSRKNHIFEHKGEKFCVIAVCENEYSYALEDRMGSRPYDEYDTMDDIREAKANGQRVIVVYHGGKEHCKYPSPRLMKLCRAMIKNGAELVLCQHSHCIGCYEKFENGHIVYGQGNYHFIRPTSPHEGWFYSLGVKYDTDTKEIEFIPMVNKEDGIALAKGDKRDKIMKEFYERCQSLADGSWIDGWRAFCDSVKENYIKNAASAIIGDPNSPENQPFAHFLDCQAHTDVWRELYKTANYRNER